MPVVRRTRAQIRAAPRAAEPADNPAPVVEDAAVTGRVLAVHGRESLIDVEGALYRCELSGRLKFRRDDAQVNTTAGHWRRDTSEVRARWSRSREHAPPSSPIAVGDFARVRVDPDGTGTVLERLDRTSWLGRIRPTKGPQVIAANVEIALVVMSVAEPEPNFFLLDQFLIQAAAGGLEPWVVFNKMDLLQRQANWTDTSTGESAGGPPLAPDASPQECRDYAEADQYRSIGYPVFCTSATRLSGVERLEKALSGRTAIMAGPSGVGKSSLLNDLIPLAEARLGEISEWSGRGQHTTTHVAMYPLPYGGYLVDAPGIRRLELWQVTPGQLPGFFPEFEELAARCDYSRCSHLDEADCAVRAGAESGAISWRRYKHYRQMRQGV